MPAIQWIDSEARILDRTKREPVQGGIRFSISLDECGDLEEVLQGELSRNMLRTWVGIVKGEYFARREGKAATGDSETSPLANGSGVQATAAQNGGGGGATVTQNIPEAKASLRELLITTLEALKVEDASLVSTLDAVEKQRSTILGRMERVKNDTVIIERALADAQKVYGTDSETVQPCKSDAG